MAYAFSTAAKNARGDAITTYAGTGAKLSIWTSAYGTKLAEWTWTGNVWNAFSSGASGAMIAPTTNPVTPSANGTAAIARLTKTDGTTVVFDGLVVATSGSEVTVSNLTFATTAPVTLNSFTVTEA